MRTGVGRQQDAWHHIVAPHDLVHALVPAAVQHELPERLVAHQRRAKRDADHVRLGLPAHARHIIRHSHATLYAPRASSRRQAPAAARRMTNSRHSWCGQPTCDFDTKQRAGRPHLRSAQTVAMLATAPLKKHTSMNRTSRQDLSAISLHNLCCCILIAIIAAAIVLAAPTPENAPQTRLGACQRPPCQTPSRRFPAQLQQYLRWQLLPACPQNPACI